MIALMGTIFITYFDEIVIEASVLKKTMENLV